MITLETDFLIFILTCPFFLGILFQMVVQKLLGYIYEVDELRDKLEKLKAKSDKK